MAHDVGQRLLPNTKNSDNDALFALTKKDDAVAIQSKAHTPISSADAELVNRNSYSRKWRLLQHYARREAAMPSVTRPTLASTASAGGEGPNLKNHKFVRHPSAAGARRFLTVAGHLALAKP
jgi:hypothetical protein